MTGQIHIVVAEPSDVIRRGICSVLMEEKELQVRLTEVSRVESLRDTLVKLHPDVVVVNPGFSALMTPAAIKKMIPHIRCVMLQGTSGDSSTAYLWDDTISLWSSAAAIREQILRPGRNRSGGRVRHDHLSKREKDILVFVVKGMTNKQIADRLRLSHHTVGTHRRNISAKLGIHSTAGLTVYAISNKLVSLNELDNMNSDD